jgi:hypothetical protein
LALKLDSSLVVVKDKRREKGAEFVRVMEVPSS